MGGFTDKNVLIIHPIFFTLLKRLLYEFLFASDTLIIDPK